MANRHGKAALLLIEQGRPPRKGMPWPDNPDSFLQADPLHVLWPDRRPGSRNAKRGPDQAEVAAGGTAGDKSAKNAHAMQQAADAAEKFEWQECGIIINEDEDPWGDAGEQQRI